MLTEVVLSSLREHAGQRLAAEREFVVCTLKLPGTFGAEGLLGIDGERVVFAQQDFVRGLESREWPRSVLGPMRVESAFLGKEILADGPEGEFKLECRRPDELAALEAALKRFGWFEPASEPPTPIDVLPSTFEEVGLEFAPSEPEPEVTAERFDVVPDRVTPGLGAAPASAPAAPPPRPEAPVETPADIAFIVGDSAGPDVDVQFIDADLARATSIPAVLAPDGSVDCPGCGRANDPRHAYCLACGARMPEHPSGGPTLTCTRGGALGQVFPVGAQTTLGRAADNEVAVPMASLSRRHARVILEGNSWIVVDLASSNGTRVNGRAISGPTPLRDGDRVGLGDDCELVFAAGDHRLVQQVDAAALGRDAGSSAALIAAVMVALAVAGLVVFLLSAPA